MCNIKIRKSYFHKEYLKTTIPVPRKRTAWQEFFQCVALQLVCHSFWKTLKSYLKQLLINTITQVLVELTQFMVYDISYTWKLFKILPCELLPTHSHSKCMELLFTWNYYQEDLFENAISFSHLFLLCIYNTNWNILSKILNRNCIVLTNKLLSLCF